MPPSLKSATDLEVAVADQIRIRPVRDADGRQLPGHWETACGYLVLPCRSLAGGFAKGVAIIRPQDEAPFAYLGCEQEAYLLIKADMEARGVSA
ncbi:hypothetical protein D9M69_705430 [compost metagenome]